MFFIYLDLKHNKADINGNMMELNSVLENISEKESCTEAFIGGHFNILSGKAGERGGGRGGEHVLKSQVVEEM